MNRYDIGGAVGAGCYGSVLQGTFKQTGKAVAIKVIQNAKGGPNSTISPAAFREMKALQQLQPHPHVVALHEVLASGSHLCLVTDLLETDLGTVLSNVPGRLPMPEATAKGLMKQLLLGVAHVHAHNLVHRDIKPGNLLLDVNGTLKIGDFGLARPLRRGSEEAMTHEVGTKWYRAPELLLGARRYTSAIDMWSCGCVYGEMLLGTPVFPGTTEIDQIIRIFQVLGSPNDKTWPQRATLPDWGKVHISPHEGIPISKLVSRASPSSVALLEGLLVLNCDARLAASEALSAPCFTDRPYPSRSGLWFPRPGFRGDQCEDWDDLRHPFPALPAAGVRQEWVVGHPVPITYPPRQRKEGTEETSVHGKDESPHSRQGIHTMHTRSASSNDNSRGSPGLATREIIFGSREGGSSNISLSPGRSTQPGHDSDDC
eukprot:Sspe_Gene.117649::Locus_109210_Transcript_1_1_Confidence_1.000_Length_1372::g.117649::m.117649/K08817/CCRK; cell cycle related kinase